MFIPILRIIILKYGFIIYKLYVILDVVFSILISFLQIIYNDRSIVITNTFKSSKTQVYLTCFHNVNRVIIDVLCIYPCTQSYITQKVLVQSLI